MVLGQFLVLKKDERPQVNKGLERRFSQYCAATQASRPEREAPDPHIKAGCACNMHLYPQCIREAGQVEAGRFQKLTGQL